MTLKNGQRFGNWVFNSKQLTLDLYNGDEIDGYYVDIEEISDSSNMLDWIFQILNKNTGKENIIGLLEAFDAIFKPQKNLCPDGQPEIIENVPQFLAARITTDAKLSEGA